MIHSKFAQTSRTVYRPRHLALLMVAALASSVLGLEPRALALDCAPPSLERDLANSDLVFQGVAKNTTSSSNSTSGAVSADFAVTKFWKGSPDVTERLKADATWGPFVTAGTPYVIFAKDSRILLCSSTRPTEGAATLIAQLGEGKTPTEEAETSGCNMTPLHRRANSTPGWLILFALPFVARRRRAQHRSNAR